MNPCFKRVGRFYKVDGTLGGYEREHITRLDTLRRETLWLAPEVGRWVARETNGEFRIAGRRGSWTGREDHFRWQLESWT